MIKYKHMTETERDDKIEALTRQGLSARKVKERLGLSINLRTVQKIARRRVGDVGINRNSKPHQLLGVMREYVHICMTVLLDKDPHLCEVCGDYTDKECQIHHTKYEGATLYDLQFACESCQKSRVNKGLA